MALRFIGVLVSLTSAATLTSAALYERVSDLPTLSYDYVIVGGGTAGNTVANRLSADPKVSVLVLEAGGSNAGVLDLIVPLLGPSTAPFTSWDWNYTVVPQAGFNGRTIPYPRGFVLGGSSSINYMVYNRGARDDFDHYAKTTGNPLLSWKNMRTWMFQNEKFVAPNDNHNTAGQYLPAKHSTTGVVSVSLAGYPLPLDSRVIDASKELSAEFPFQVDHNAGNAIGVGWTQATVGDGQRSSSATAYLGPQYISRPNLSVLLHARTTKVVQTGTSNGKPVFGAVQFAASASGASTTVTAKKEVILSAGSFNSPQLLMLSGIGPAAVLKSAGVPVLIDNPSVGQNMSDHVLLATPYYVNSNDTFEDHLTSDRISGELANWSATHKGPLSYTLTNQLAWLRLKANDTIFNTVPDPSPGPTSAHHELIFTNGFVGQDTPPAGANFMSVFTNLISPTSRGSVHITSNNGFDAPSIDPNFLATDFDIHTMVESIKAARRFFTAKSFNDYIIKPYSDVYANAKTDADIAQYVRDNSGSVWHAVGTAVMTPFKSSYGVVNPDFTVKGTVGLRVVDASVIPVVGSAHTQGPVYLFAELAAGIIRGGAKLGIYQ